ncbi:hypothetical protein NDU88_004457 [Pleurodeles waltl]|uniref:Uncharacterized protein n=1 Tax=Pleurodeles waltl TaxID=8319 RepID=A0AAV7PE26_PLEWA|nr:hypothetical protein NDU88_004457 [Pleurodeles waltl]
MGVPSRGAPALCAASALGAHGSGLREPSGTSLAAPQSRPRPPVCAVTSGAGPRSRGTDLKPHLLRCQCFLPSCRDGPRAREDRGSSLRPDLGSEGWSQSPATQADGPRPFSLGSAAPSCSLFSGVRSALFRKIVLRFRCPTFEQAAPYTVKGCMHLEQDI